MALKNLFDMVKADRYTQDGREAIIKAQEAETEDKVYQIGEISQKTGLQKTANGWVKPPRNKEIQNAGKHAESVKAAQKAKKEEARRQQRAEGEANARAFQEKVEKGEIKPDGAEVHQQQGEEIKGNLEAAKYYFDKAQSFSPTDPSYKTYMTKAKQYNDEAKSQADDNGFDFEEMHNSGITQAVNKYAEEQNKPAAANKTTIRQVLNTALTPSGDKVQMTKSKVTGDFHVLLNGKSTGGGFRDPQKAKERINKRFDESEARSQKAMETAEKPERFDYRSSLEKNPRDAFSFKGTVTHSIPTNQYHYDELQNLASFMREEKATYQNALKSRAQALVDGHRSNGDWEPKKEQALMDIAKAVGFDEELHKFIEEENRGYDLGYSEDSAPRVLTGDCRIRIRKEKPALTGDTKIRVRK